MTNAINLEANKKMIKNLKGMNFENVIDILAKRIQLPNRTYIESYGLDKLVQLTVIRCKEQMIYRYNKIQNINVFIRKIYYQEIQITRIL